MFSVEELQQLCSLPGAAEGAGEGECEDSAYPAWGAGGPGLLDEGGPELLGKPSQTLAPSMSLLPRSPPRYPDSTPLCRHGAIPAGLCVCASSSADYPSPYEPRAPAAAAFP